MNGKVECVKSEKSGQIANFESIEVNHRVFDGKSYAPIKCAEDEVYDAGSCQQVCTGWFDKANMKCSYTIKKENKGKYK